tara:strand:+ start:390 stop:680 length:291 start_codon:yes stop_codon:yes gene_type:complete
MKLENLAKNQTLVKLTNDKELFYSYKTIVSAKLKDKYYYTSFKYGPTTTRHINNYLKDNKKDAIKVEQNFLDNLLDNNIIDITPVKKELLKIKSSK